MLYRSRFLAVVLLGLFVCSPVMAQDLEPPMYEAPDLQALFAKPLGVRNLGMGWTGVADGAVAENLYFNPANLTSHGGLEISASSQNWFDMIDVLSIGGATRFRIRVGDDKSIHISPGLWYTEHKEEYTATNPEGQSTTIESKDKYLNLALAAGFRTSRFEIGLGAAVKPAWIDFVLNDDEAQAWAFDVGAKVGMQFFDLDGHKLDGTLGGSILNAGGDAEGDYGSSEMPTETRLGMAFLYRSRPVDTRVQRDIPGVKLYLNMDLIDRSFQDGGDNGTDSEDSPLGAAIGAELCLFNTFNFRYGYMDDGANGLDSTSWGLGIQFANEKFRFAADLSHMPEIFEGGPSVTSTGLGMSWFY